MSAAKPPDRMAYTQNRLQRRESASLWTEGLPALIITTPYNFPKAGRPSLHNPPALTFHFPPCRHFRLYITPMMGATLGYKKKTPKYLLLRRLHLIEGGYLLSHFRTTIGVTGFNFSVRNGKRWNPRAITTLVSSVKEIYSLMPSAYVGFPHRIRLEKEFWKRPFRVEPRYCCHFSTYPTCVSCRSSFISEFILILNSLFLTHNYA